MSEDDAKQKAVRTTMAGKNPPSVLLRILVIDDEPNVHATLAVVMMKPPPANVEMFPALTMEDGMKMAERINPHVILLDLNLKPEWTWNRTLAMIPTIERLGRCPVIAFSGLDPDEMWPASIAAGAYNFFSKLDALTHSFRAQLLNDIATARFLYKRINTTPPNVPQSP